MRHSQRGLATVEFAIIGAVVMMVLFAVIELGRELFIVNTLVEATRRGARMAAVCPVGDPRPGQAAVFDSGDGSSAIVNGLTTGHVVVAYLDMNGAAIANPAGSFSSIRYVRVSIVNFTQQLIIPMVMPEVVMSGFSTTLPRESLGIPRVGVVQPC